MRDSLLKMGIFRGLRAEAAWKFILWSETNARAGAMMKNYDSDENMNEGEKINLSEVFPARFGRKIEIYFWQIELYLQIFYLY